MAPKAMKASTVMKAAAAKKAPSAMKAGKKIIRPLGRRKLRAAFVLELKRKAQAQRGNKVGGGSKDAVDEQASIPNEQRAGWPLVPTEVKPEDWKTREGKPVYVDFSRVPWLPDDCGQGVKMTNQISRSREGVGGTYRVWVTSDGHVFYHKHALEAYLDRGKLDARDGFNGQLRLRSLQTRLTDEKAFFDLLTPAERKVLPKADDIHFCVVSARRTQTAEGISDICGVIAAFRTCGVDPTWYVDEASLEDYKKIGLKAVVGGKLTPARNKALKDAAKLGKACVQCSDDIASWEYRDGKTVVEKRDDALANKAHSEAEVHHISPVTAARFMLAKLRGSGPGIDEEKRPRLAGVYPLGSCARSFFNEAFTRDNFILGDFFVADLSPVRFDENMTLKEDYDFTCQHIHKHGSVIRCNRMTVMAKHQTNAGGACSNRDQKGEAERRNIAILNEKWPRAFRPHPRRANEVIMRWPSDFAGEGSAKKVKKDLAGKIRTKNLMKPALKREAAKALEEWKSRFPDDMVDKLTAPAHWQAGMYPDPSARDCNWLPKGWLPAMQVTRAAKLERCFVSPQGQGYRRKEDVQAVAAGKLVRTGADGRRLTLSKVAMKVAVKVAMKAPGRKKLPPVEVPKEFSEDAKLLAGDRASQAEYIQKRCAAATGRRVADVLGKLTYQDKHGETHSYSYTDLKYDLTRDFLKLQK